MRKVIWVVVDLSNGDGPDHRNADAKHYCSWFFTRKDALKFKRQQERGWSRWRPSEPMKYVKA